MNQFRSTSAVLLAYMVAVALLSTSYVHVNAAYPSALIWSDCGQDKCASLEFCRDGSYYGYRNPGDMTPCGIVANQVL
eukprot:scaffold7315_cov119-Skeletonema_menzelii.AAC.3